MKNRYKKDDYSVFLKHVEADKKENSSFAKTLLIGFLILTAFVIAFLATINNPQTVERMFGRDTFMSNMLISFIEKKSHRKNMDFGFPFFHRRQNILLLGVDSNGSNTDPWKGTRSDTIVILSIDAKNRSVKAVSVPRDSKVYLAGDNGIQKINAAHAIGGVNLTKRTVEEVLGIKIDKCIEISDDAVANLVDTLGGVPIYVEKPMNYDDFSGNLHIHLNKGTNVLKGRQAVGYLRFRHDGLGDIGRTQRQQWFLKGLMEKLQSPQAIPKIPEMVNIAQKYVKTDISIYEMSQLAALAKNLDLDDLEVATLPGRPNKRGSLSYWILDPEKTQEVVNRMIYRDIPSITSQKLNAGIMYSQDKASQANALKNELETLGYDVTCFSRGHLPHSQFVANSGSITTEFFNSLKKKAPNLDIKQFVYDPNKFYCSSSDFVVILSGQ